jgi:hypothetical protein
MTSRLSRRRMLALSGSIATICLTGCAIQEVLADCRSGREPVESPDPVAYSTVEQLRLSSIPTEVPKGEQITFTLENIGETQVHTGRKTKFTIEKRAAGWKPIYWVRKGYGRFQTAPRHDLGPIYHWTFTASQYRFETADQPYHICTDIEPRTYRFVYWGLVGVSEPKPEGIATRFQIAP